MKRIRALLPLIVTAGLVVAMGGVALRASAQANRKAAAVHRHDRESERTTLAGLTNQYVQFTFKEAFDAASTPPWELTANSGADAARLEAFVNRSALLQHGAALVSLKGEPLTVFAKQPGVPQPADPGYAPLQSALKAGKPGLSAVMRVGSAPVVAVGVPVMVDGAPRALLLGYFRTDQSALQTYNERLRQNRPTSTSYVLDGNGVIATSTDRSLVGRRVVRNPGLARAHRGKTGFITFTAEGKELTTSYAPIGVGGWSTIDVESADEFYGAIRAGRQGIDLALLALLAVTATGMMVLHLRVQRAHRRSENRFRSLVQHASDIITVVDSNGVICYDSPAVERILGYGPRERIGRSGIELLHPEEQDRAVDLLAEMAGHPGMVVRTEFRVRRKDDTYVWFECIGTNLTHDPTVRGFVVNLRDITERRAFQEQLSHQAFHDALTGLPNRALFQDRLAVAMARRRKPGNTLALLFLDLDRFKVVNDTLGHDIGDQVLIAVAERLADCVRGQDTLARMSGDEFTVLVDEVEDEADAVRVAERIIDALRSPLCINGNEVFVGASIGIALARDNHEADGLIRDADLAMYRAKERGRRRYEIFAGDLGVQVRDRLELEGDLRGAIEHGDLSLHFQPEVDLQEFRVIGFEALVRWQHPARGMMLPGQFISMAEETGLIVALGEWVLEEACRQGRRWIDHNPDRPLRMSVNVSGRQLQQQAPFVATVARVLQETGFPARLLTLELTESVLIDDAEASIRTLHDLRALGLELAIDDFGTGYSSLTYLKHLPISTLKLDRSFVHGLGDDSVDARIARAMIELAHSLDVAVTAEGIELVDQLFQLQNMGCDRGQGFHFSKPVPADMAERILAGTVANPGR